MPPTLHHVGTPDTQAAFLERSVVPHTTPYLWVLTLKMCGAAQLSGRFWSPSLVLAQAGTGAVALGEGKELVGPKFGRMGGSRCTQQDGADCLSS